jgi:hypothetical protein
MQFKANGSFSLIHLNCLKNTGDILIWINIHIRKGKVKFWANPGTGAVYLWSSGPDACTTCLESEAPVYGGSDAGIH